MDVSIRAARADEIEHLARLDVHVTRAMLQMAVEQNRCCIITADGQPAGVMRYGWFWDSIPFLNLIYIEENLRDRGIGTQAMRLWHSEMKQAGFDLVMTSTQSDEEAQRFYRALGYRDTGCMMFDQPGYEQPMEIILALAL